ncbi:TonB-dependent receptor [Rosettibacter firmus]|uniref:TonB-dependent receptor n=1 Tax=Rosettibacter firmus TaxID=3111522 RepID=UPI00336C179B
MKSNFYKSFYLLIFFTSQLILAQGSGSIKGKVIDSNTKEPLVGANVVIVNTSLGAATDYDGKFVIHNVPTGKRVIKISYIGYKTKVIEIDVGTKIIDLQDIPLEQQVAIELEVVVTAQARGQRDAINKQLSSNTIKNVVSAERIRELPDESAAAALSRLPGMSLMDGDKIVVRGIQAKQNVILMNGIQLPSTDMNDRSVNLGFISSNMLSGIEVIKVLTPDMDANAIGGVVNLRIMEAPENFHFDVLSQGTYNSQDRTLPNDNYKFWVSASNRFFNNKLGIFVQGNIDRVNAGGDITNAGYQKGVDTMGYGLAEYRMLDFAFSDEENIVTNTGGSVVIDYKLPNGKIFLQNTLAHTVNDMARYRTEFDFAENSLFYTLNRDKHNKELLINALQAEYNFGKFKTELSLSHSYSDKNTDIRYGDPGLEFGFRESKGQPFVKYENGNMVYVTYVRERDYMTPDDVYKIQLDPDAWKRSPIYGWAGMRSEAFKQNLYTAKLDLSYPISITQAISGTIKLGGKYDFSKRNNNVEESYHRVGDPDFYNAVSNFFTNKVISNSSPLMFADIRNYDYKRGDYFLDGTYDFEYAIDKKLMDSFLPKSVSGWLKSRHRAKSERDDFEGKETFKASYIMGEFSIGSKFNVILGARYEHFNRNYKANFFYVTHAVDGDGVLYDTLNNANRNEENIFPNLQLRYKITDWADLRAAYSKSISRPDYLALLPNIYYEPGGGASAGNPNLKPTVTTNYDLAMYFYSNKLGLLTVTGFYKKLKDVFFQTQFYYQNIKSWNVWFPDSALWNALKLQAPNRSQLVTSYVNNPNPGYLRGFEIEWQTNFWYLPKPFNSLVLNINYTRTWSKMDYQVIENIDSVAGSGIRQRHYYLTKSRVYSGRLLHQADHILNIAIGIDYKDFSGRISYNLKDAVTSYVGVRPEEDQLTGTIHRWDLTLQQKLPIKGFSIFFNGVNLFRKPIKTYRDFRRPNQTEIISNLVSTSYYPTFYEIVLRYSL